MPSNEEVREYAEGLRDEAWNEYPPGSLRGMLLLRADEIEEELIEE